MWQWMRWRMYLFWRVAPDAYVPLPAARLELTCRQLGYSSRLRKRKGERGRGGEGRGGEGRREREGERKEVNMWVYACVHARMCVCVCGKRGEKEDGISKNMGTFPIQWSQNGVDSITHPWITSMYHQTAWPRSMYHHLTRVWRGEEMRESCTCKKRLFVLTTWISTGNAIGELFCNTLHLPWLQIKRRKKRRRESSRDPGMQSRVSIISVCNSSASNLPRGLAVL